MGADDPWPIQKQVSCLDQEVEIRSACRAPERGALGGSRVIRVALSGTLAATPPDSDSRAKRRALQPVVTVPVFNGSEMRGVGLEGVIGRSLLDKGPVSREQRGLSARPASPARADSPPT